MVNLYLLTRLVKNYSTSRLQFGVEYSRYSSYLAQPYTLPPHSKISSDAVVNWYFVTCPLRFGLAYDRLNLSHEYY